ncbi:hypothetical protein GYMLUDRAFT_162048 [Collybiopsis luxurians FD-317 M1]|uniref:Uncharacterized protein n=1 Tax=Collybiopsis luxurians FD-317 M1 TaxID=944289 RepID=A0A0D0BJA2_9AGAR|nr:hypothetical protein GYMLUDRAFT_162048 [Collybiopsis luxurians FD-317 M1]
MVAGDFTPVIGSTRSTAGIVWSCITTIFACTWLAVHPNVPSIHASQRELFWRRVKILIVALIAPEFIIVWAANQLRCARGALKTLREFNACRHWTMTHGMFLAMGGFMLTDASGKCLQVLQVKQLSLLLPKDAITLPHISESEIMDKSKGDALAKTLVLIQTTWFIAQVISRAVLHLPIAELELTTVAFALLNFLTYALWWKKPLDVQHPILLALSPGVSKSILDESDTINFSTDADTVSTKNGAESLAQKSGLGPDAVETTSPHSFTVLSPSWGDKNQTSRKPLLSMASSFITSVWAYFRRLVGGFIIPEPISVPKKDQKYTDNVPLFYSGPSRPTPGEESWSSQYFFYIRSTTLEMLIGTLFGSIHCAAWTFHFPSKLERDLWQIMSICITAVPLAIIIGVMLTFSGRFLFLKGRNHYLLFVIYILARLTIFIMAFVLLRDLPEGAFQEIQWTTYIPHV